MAATVAAARDPELAGALADGARPPRLGAGAAHDAAAQTPCGRRGRPAGRCAEVLAGRTDVDVAALLDAAPDIGEAGAQVDAVLADHRPTDRGNRMSAVAVSYTVDGAADAPVVVLSNSLGATRGMWDPQVPGLAERYRVVTYDTRGHGESPAPAGPYTLDDLVDDLVALLDEVGAAAGARRRALARRDDGDAAGRPGAAAGRPAGPAVHLGEAGPDSRSSTGRPPSAPAAPRPLAPTVASRWLTPPYAAEHPDLVAKLEAMIAGSDDEGYAACCEVVAAVDLRADCARITAPTLVISGWEDPALPPEHQKLIADSHPGRRAGHRQPRRPPGEPGAAARR